MEKAFYAKGLGMQKLVDERIVASSWTTNVSVFLVHTIKRWMNWNFLPSKLERH